MRFSLLIIYALVVVSCSSASWSVMTYNIRYDNPADGNNAWKHRNEDLVNQVLEFKPYFIGFQEALHHQVQFLDSTMVDYAFIGVGRDDGYQAGEYSPIFYNKKYIRCISQNTFWLSDTPDTVSVGWDAALERICTYGQFEDQAGKTCWVFNTHFDHVGELARRESAGLILKKIAEVTGENDKIFLMGDFNLPLNSPPIEMIGKEMINIHLDNRKSLNEVTATFNGFKLDHQYKSIIDHIFFKGNYINLEKGGIIDNLGGASYLSDHYPVWGVFRIK